MTCPTIDELSRYADDLLVGEELLAVRAHVATCRECQEIIDVFKGEEQFIRDTLKEPVLPDDFTAQVLKQLEPKKKKGKKVWPRRIAAVAASLLLAVGIGAAVNPGFAAQISSLFSSEKVDEGLRIASESGLTERVNLETTDKGLTFKIEEMIVDSSRISISHQIMNGKGRVLNNFGVESEVRFTIEGGEEIEASSEMWHNAEDYGVFEFSIPTEYSAEKVVIHFHLTEINGVKGDWQLAVPVDMEGVQEKTSILSLDQMEKSVDDVSIQMKEIQYAPSSSTLFYETSYTENALEKIDQEVKSFEQKYGMSFRDNFMFGTGLQYHIKNEEDEIVFRNYSAEEEEKDSFLQSSGKILGEIGHLAKMDSFVPQLTSRQLTFVLEGVKKEVPANYAVQVDTAALKEQAITFDYEGNSLQIKEVKKEVDYFFRKSLIPIKRQKYFTIHLEVAQEPFAPELNTWALIDDQGQAHEVYRSGSTDELTLSVYGLDKMPENFTLHLLTKTSYTEVQEKWEVPLYK